MASLRDVLGLHPEPLGPDFWMAKLPDGSKVQVFGPDSPVNRHFTTGPVAGFLVDDVFLATAELRSAGIEILLEPDVDDKPQRLGALLRAGRQHLRVHPGSRSVRPA